MCEVSISHFKEFPIDARMDFTSRVRDVLAQEIYHVATAAEIPKPDGVTVLTTSFGPDSYSDSPSGTEVKVDLDGEEWATDDAGLLLREPKLLETHYSKLAANIGKSLVGGVMREGGLAVCTWVRQLPATGWYDGS